MLDGLTSYGLAGSAFLAFSGLTLFFWVFPYKIAFYYYELVTVSVSG